MSIGDAEIKGLVRRLLQLLLFDNGSFEIQNGNMSAIKRDRRELSFRILEFPINSRHRRL